MDTKAGDETVSVAELLIIEPEFAFADTQRVKARSAMSFFMAVSNLRHSDTARCSNENDKYR